MIDKFRLEAHLNNGIEEYVMCAAIYIDDGKDYMFKPYNIDKGLVYCGWRHPCIFETMPYKQSEIRRLGYKEIQGFLTNKNRFLSRDEAEILVKENGQLKQKMIGGCLTSEDLW